MVGVNFDHVRVCADNLLVKEELDDSRLAPIQPKGFHPYAIEDGEVYLRNRGVSPRAEFVYEAPQRILLDDDFVDC